MTSPVEALISHPRFGGAAGIVGKVTHLYGFALELFAEKMGISQRCRLFSVRDWQHGEFVLDPLVRSLLDAWFAQLKSGSHSSQPELAHILEWAAADEQASQWQGPIIRVLSRAGKLWAPASAPSGRVGLWGGSVDSVVGHRFAALAERELQHPTSRIQVIPVDADVTGALDRAVEVVERVCPGLVGNALAHV